MTERLDFRLLGPLEVARDDELIDLGGYKQRSLLALFLIHANRVVSTDRIIDALWGEEAADKENALWVYISRLRSVLEPERTGRGENSVLLTKDPGYALEVDPGQVDFLRFELGLDQARVQIETDPQKTVETLDEVLGLWRGNPLEDFAYEEFTRNEVGRLSELRLEASELRVDARLALGQTGELVSALQAFARENPYRERPVGQLMIALYRSGRQAEALRAYEQHRRILSDELGIDPSPELRRLEEQILLHDERLVARRQAPLHAVADRALPNPYRGLHAFRESDESRFFGRESLVADLLRRLDNSDRLIAVVGPSGSGKSSVVHAGLIPRLRKGALGEYSDWVIAQMVPGAHPFDELEAGLLRSRLDGPDSLSDQLATGPKAILKAGLRMLPDGNARLLLVIDQFEELFTLVGDRDVQRHFLEALLAAIEEPHGRITVVLTLRADFYDRPLLHPAFGARLGTAVVNVTPLSAAELEEAALQPAAIAGVRLEPKLLARLLADVLDETGALPMFQYTMTELFERRDGDALLESSYEQMGGVRG
ncbi:MAG: BTAD domain-containing putative transcriptional regulator, partial [Actinomycetota bacterium]|nr:BTAD domain-containing putative transcriptional regulator [Actinomycetota bacterium]